MLEEYDAAAAGASFRVIYFPQSNCICLSDSKKSPPIFLISEEGPHTSQILFLSPPELGVRLGNQKPSPSGHRAQS